MITNELVLFEVKRIQTDDPCVTLYTTDVMYPVLKGNAKMVTTFYLLQLNRSTFGASVVDYVIADYDIFQLFNVMTVHDLSEFSDHCLIEFSMNFTNLSGPDECHIFRKK